MVPRTLISISGLSIKIHDTPLFEDLSASIHRGELLAIIGANGCGKSTLFDFLDSRVTGEPGKFDNAGYEITGSVSFAPGIRIAHLQQVPRDIAMPQSDTDYGFRGMSGRELKLCNEFKVANYEGSDGVISDGELQKRAIIRTLMEDADLYLLDEPSNYLDIVAITALEDYILHLKQERKGVMLITHDRALADNVADQTILITDKDIYRTSDGATNARSVMSADIKSRQKQTDDIRKRIDRLQENARAKAGWSATSEKRKIGAGAEKPHFAKLSAKMAKRAKVMLRHAEREVRKLEHAKPFIPKELNLHLPEYSVRNRNVFRLEDVCFRYENEAARCPVQGYLLKNIILSASTRDKICLMGSNGSGKSTIVRLIREQVQCSTGVCYVNNSVKTAYIPQGLSGFFTRSHLLDNFDDCNHDQTTIRKHLGAALIRRDKVHEPISAFSRGELMRAAIVKCILARAEFLFLDEPTTHLDIESIEVLEQLLQNFTGGFLLISHDRAFVSNTAEKLYMLEGRSLRLI